MQIVVTTVDDPRSDKIYVGRTAKYGKSALGNPYSHRPNANAIRVSSIKAALESYENWLAVNLEEHLFETQQSKAVKAEFRELCKILTERGILILSCHCSTPDKIKPCHAHIIAARIASEVGINYESTFKM